MSQLRNDMTSDIQAMQTRWGQVRNSTKSKLSSINFTNTENGTQRAVSYRNDLKDDLNEHEHLAARGKNIRRDLNAQVESSENHVTRMNKHGKAALFFFALLGLATGAGIGSRVPGVEKAIAIPVGAVIGLIGFAVVGLFIYCIFKCRFEKQRDDWQNFQRSNLGDIALVDEINGKKSGLSEICNKLNDLEEGNMQSGRRVLAQDIEAY